MDYKQRKWTIEKLKTNDKAFLENCLSKLEDSTMMFEDETKLQRYIYAILKAPPSNDDLSFECFVEEHQVYYGIGTLNRPLDHFVAAGIFEECSEVIDQLADKCICFNTHKEEVITKLWKDDEYVVLIRLPAKSSYHTEFLEYATILTNGNVVFLNKTYKIFRC